MRKITVLVTSGLIALAVAAFGFTGCEKKPEERLKNALQDVKDAAGDIIQDASKQLEKNAKNTGEKAVKKITEDAGKAVNDAVKAIEDKLK